MDEVYSGMSLTYFSFDLFVKILVLAYIDDHGKIKTSVFVFTKVNTDKGGKKCTLSLKTCLIVSFHTS